MKALLNVLTSTHLLWTALFLGQTVLHSPPSEASTLSPPHELLRFEQAYVNRTLDENKIVALKNYQNSYYSPEAAQIFDVPSFWVEADNLHVFTVPELLKDLGIKWKKTIKGKNFVLFLIHPESLDFYDSFIKTALEGPRFKGTATASSRTLMMWPDENPEKIFFGKLSLNKQVAGVVRTIPAGEVARSLGTTQILYQNADALPEQFHYFPEALGVMPKGWERGGMIIRLLPTEMTETKKRVMPLFALYTKPANKKTSPLEDNIKRSKLAAEDFVTNRILKPFAKLWTEIVLDHRLAIEAHAQNVLIQIDSKGQIEPHFYFRDFGGFNFDLTSRAQRNFKDLNLPVIRSLQEDYHQLHSLGALRSSLGVYFEGGFLFGLAEELQRLGYEHLTYEKLIILSRQQVSDAFKDRGFQLRLENFWADLEASFKKPQPTSLWRACRSVFN